MKYVRNELVDKYGILELQDKLLEIMVDIDLFCEKYNIEYCLMAGSALGAERHAGFIPWDDDIDIYMTENDYNKFRMCFFQHGNKKKYYLQEWGKTDNQGKKMVTMAKIRKNETEITEKSYMGWKMHQGIFVDIFILHNCADDMKSQRIQYLWSEAVVVKGLQTRGYKSKNLKDFVVLLVSKILPRKWILKNGLKQAYKYDTQITSYYHGFIDTRKFSRAIFPKEVMMPGRYVDFETVKLKVPNNNKKYLSIQFGENYMTPPPEKEIPLNKHTIGWKEDKNLKYRDFSDEKKLI